MRISTIDKLNKIIDAARWYWTLRMPINEGGLTPADKLNLSQAEKWPEWIRPWLTKYHIAALTPVEQTQNDRDFSGFMNLFMQNTIHEIVDDELTERSRAIKALMEILTTERSEQLQQISMNARGSIPQLLITQSALNVNTGPAIVVPFICFYDYQPVKNIKQRLKRGTITVKVFYLGKEVSVMSDPSSDIRGEYAIFIDPDQGGTKLGTLTIDTEYHQGFAISSLNQERYNAMKDMVTKLFPTAKIIEEQRDVNVGDEHF